MKKTKRIIGSIVVLILLLAAVMAFAFYFFTTKVSDDATVKEITITEGMNTSDVATLLKENNLIRNELTFKILVRLKKLDNIYAAQYKLSENMSTYEIIEAIEDGGENNDTITMTFREGLNIKSVEDVVIKETSNTKEDYEALLKDEAFLNEIIEKYWFISDDIKNPELYYSLEGYLYPDTYEFSSRDVTVKEIFITMLDQMETVLDKYKADIEKSKFSVHQLLTLASITELEGTDEASRKGIASVFYNRLNEGMSLGSDVTTYYGARVDMSERDLTQAELDEQNAYNTRASGMAGKLPVGPVSLPSEQAIVATISPDDSDNLFFVADKNGDVYFTKTDEEHNEIIEKLQDEGLWYEW